MINRVISILMTAIMSLTGTTLSGFDTVIDTFSEMLYGLPVTSQSINADFFSNIDAFDYTLINDETAYINNKIAVFVNGKTDFDEKRETFKKIGGRVVGWSAPIDLFVVRYSSRMSYDDILAKCKEIADMDTVELAIPVVARKSIQNATPNDSFDTDPQKTIVWDEKKPSGRNWWLEAINARQAWDYSDYFSTINIGVVDGGFDTSHEELEGKISFPTFLHKLCNVPDIHGTHVAGIIAAKHNNGVGIAGVCENSNLICVDWYPYIFNIWNTELAIYFGLSNCVKAGAKVVNFSLGTCSSAEGVYMSLMDEVISPAAVSYMMASLLSKGYDFVAVQSAGNGDMNGDPVDSRQNGHFCNINEENMYTGSYEILPEEIMERILIVGSVKNSGNGKYVQSDFSNVGPEIDISAPGEEIYSSIIGDEYDNIDGTSMAAPIVSGVAGLVWSANPDLKGTEVKEIICKSTNSVAEINKKYNYYYYDYLEFYEYPVVDAKMAVEEAIRRGNNKMGTVKGTVSKSAATIVFDGVSHTVFSDGSFSFVAPAGSGVAQVKNSSGSVIDTFSVTVKAGKIVIV